MFRPIAKANLAETERTIDMGEEGYTTREEAMRLAEGKPILDMTCGGRMMWFDHDIGCALFLDKRRECLKLCDGRTYDVNPDVLGDWCSLPFDDETFSLVVFDPPHMKSIGANYWLAQKYGKLLADWRDVFREAGKEAMRVLKPNGVLIFKWCEYDITTEEVVKALGLRPLFGHPCGKLQKTQWITYMKGISDIKEEAK